MKKTVVIGASENPEKYAFIATNMLNDYGHEVVPVGQEAGVIAEIPIQTGMPIVTDVDTVTLYVSAKRQPPLYEYIEGLNPKRVIFNPGTENPDFEEILQKRGIEVEEACTLVLLKTGQY